MNLPFDINAISAHNTKTQLNHDIIPILSIN